MNLKQNSRELKWFLIAGGCATCVNYLVFLILFQVWQVIPSIAAALGYISGMGIGFFFNKYVSFQSKKKSPTELFRYFTLYILTLAINVGLMHIFTIKESLIGPNVIYVFVIMLTTILNFIGCKWWVFKA